MLRPRREPETKVDGRREANLRKNVLRRSIDKFDSSIVHTRIIGSGERR
jgi:hypothetical protein